MDGANETEKQSSGVNTVRKSVIDFSSSLKLVRKFAPAEEF